MAVDIENEEAALPGTRNCPISFVHSSDIADFVVASLDLLKWDKESYFWGAEVTWDGFLRIAEEVKSMYLEQNIRTANDILAQAPSSKSPTIQSNNWTQGRQRNFPVKPQSIKWC